jgi:hypothetical protein
VNEYASMNRNGQTRFAPNGMRSARHAVPAQHRRAPDTYQIERLLEFVERGPDWFRSLVWDLMVSFMKDDDGEFEIGEMRIPSRQ